LTNGFHYYHLNFIQKKPCADNSAHLFTLVYTFHSEVTKLKYVVQAEYHVNNIFAIKFYAKPHRKSDLKYSKIVNKGDVHNILTTIASLVPHLLKTYPDASFGFIGSRSYDKKVQKVEPYSRNQRFRIYGELVKRLFGDQTFSHFSYDEISAYLLVNKSVEDVKLKRRQIEIMFIDTYTEIHNLFI